MGKINVLAGRLQPGRVLRIGEARPQCALDAAAPRDVTVYLRPEDLPARPIAAGDANVFDVLGEWIEFHGSYCQVSVHAPAFGPQRLTVYLSFNFIAERGLQVGRRLPLQVLHDHAAQAWRRTFFR